MRVLPKDDTLGLGASLKSRNVEEQRTGLDAFQGLLGRLNAKTDEEVQKVEKKFEDKKLAMYAQGRWGGMVFVPGGLLVQKDPHELVKGSQLDVETEGKPESQKVDAEKLSDGQGPTPTANEAEDTISEKTRRKAEKRQRKEDRRIRKEARRLRRARRTEEDGATNKSCPVSTAPTTDTSEVSSGVVTPMSAPEDINGRQRIPTNQSIMKMKNGRHVLRGRHIQAKKMAFSDLKMLNEIFMRDG